MSDANSGVAWKYAHNSNQTWTDYLNGLNTKAGAQPTWNCDSDSKSSNPATPGGQPDHVDVSTECVDDNPTAGSVQNILSNLSPTKGTADGMNSTTTPTYSTAGAGSHAGNRPHLSVTSQYHDPNAAPEAYGRNGFSTALSYDFLDSK